MSSFDLKQFQKDHKEWVTKNFGQINSNTWRQAFMGIVEEVGELSHSFLKQSQSIRGSHEKHESDAKDSIGDIMIYICHLCSCRGWDLEDILKNTWDSVKQRDWKKFPNNGIDN